MPFYRNKMAPLLRLALHFGKRLEQLLCPAAPLHSYKEWSTGAEQLSGKREEVRVCSSKEWKRRGSRV
jgi:hypothetical protein